MTYLSDKSKYSRRSFRGIVLVILLACITFFWPQVRGVMYPYAESILLGIHGVYESTRALPTAFRTYSTSHADAEARITVLENQVEDLENKLVFQETTLDAAPSTKDTSMMKQSIVLFPVAHDVSTLYGNIILSKGFKDGMKEDSLVYLRGRQAVCVIDEVHAVTSRCALLSAPGAIVQGVVRSSSGEQVVSLTGDGGNYTFTVPRDSSIKIGDVVMYQRDQSLTLGTVSDIKSDLQDVLLRVYVRGVYNPVTAARLYVDKE